MDSHFSFSLGTSYFLLGSSFRLIKSSVSSSLDCSSKLLAGKATTCSLWVFLSPHLYTLMLLLGFPGGLVGKEPACNAGDAGDMGSIPGSGRSPGGGHSNPLQYSCLENPMDRGAWWAIAHNSQSQTRLKWLSMHASFSHLMKNKKKQIILLILCFSTVVIYPFPSPQPGAMQGLCIVTSLTHCHDPTGIVLIKDTDTLFWLV